MDELIEGRLLFSSYLTANVYKIIKRIGAFRGGEVYKLLHCTDSTIYIAVSYEVDYEQNIDVQQKGKSCTKFQQLKEVCKSAYGGRFYGNRFISPIDYHLSKPFLISKSISDKRGRLILIYPEYKQNDFIPVIEMIHPGNVRYIMKDLITQLEYLHGQGAAAGGFREYNVLLNQASNQFHLVLGANLLSGINGTERHNKYLGIENISLEAKGFLRNKYLGLPKCSFWEKLDIGKYARCADIYSIMTIGFIGLVGYHPLQGGLCDGIESKEVRQEIFQTNPVFIFSPYNTTNTFGLWEDEEAAVRRWEALPDALKLLYYGLYAFPNWDKCDAEREIDHAAYLDLENWMKAWNELEPNTGENNE